MFEGGVRYANKVWALYTDKPVPEQDGPRGVFRPDQRSVQFEAFPMITEHDVLVRVRTWGADGTPAELEGFYMLAVPQRRSLRTGSRFGQHSWDVVAQKAQLSELPSSMKMITNYPVLGKTFVEAVPIPVVATPAVPGVSAAPQGPSTAQILSGSGPPSNITGNPGDFYIDITTDIVYGPKQE
jgi:hypothetical protein